MDTKTLNITITEPGMRRALQMFRSELRDHSGMVDAIVDLAFTLGAMVAADTMKAGEFDERAIVVERERIIIEERM